MGAQMTDRLLSAEELARHLGVEENTVYRWSRAGRIPALKVGRWWRFRAADVEHALARGSHPSRDLSGPLGAALERGDHVIAYDLEPGLAGRLTRAFVAAGLERGATVARVTWDADGTDPARPSGAAPGQARRLVALDARSVPVERAERALLQWARALSKRSGGATGLWMYGSPPPPSVDPRIARLEAVLMKLAPREGWIVLCLHGRAALPDRARLADAHTGELAATADEVRVLVARR